MSNDKRIIAALLDALEDAYLDRTVFMAMIMTICENKPELGDWEPMFEKLKSEQKQFVQQDFSALREAVARSRDVEWVLQEFLKGTPRKGPVH